MGNSWDFRVNGYIPVSSQSIIPALFADQMGIYSYVTFTGHTQFDQLFNTNTNVARVLMAKLVVRFRFL